MGILNDFLHATGFRSAQSYHRHNAYDRGEITRATFKESARQEREFQRRASQLTVEDYERVYGKR